MADQRALLAVALLLAAPAGAEDSQPGEWIAPEVMEHADWSTACDNAKDCTAVSVSREYVARVRQTDPGDYATPKLWVMRRAGPNARARVFVDTRVWGEARSVGRLTLHVYQDCDGDCTGRAYALREIETGRYELAPDSVAAFLAESARTSRAATRRADGSMHGIITTSGMVAALRYIDEAQGRRDTVTALYARGGRPAGAVPFAKARPAVFVMRGVEDDGPPGPALAQVRAEVQAQCPEVKRPDAAAMQRYRLRGGERIWGIDCTTNPAAPRALWLIESPKGTIAVNRFPRPEQGRSALVPVLPNSNFDPASGQITAYSGGMCGWRRRWAWTGKGFEMIDAIEMPACLDIMPAQWLQTYRAVPQ